MVIIDSDTLSLTSLLASFLSDLLRSERISVMMMTIKILITPTFN